MDSSDQYLVCNVSELTSYTCIYDYFMFFFISVLLYTCSLAIGLLQPDLVEGGDDEIDTAVSELKIRLYQQV